jgi:hypothetical protein
LKLQLPLIGSALNDNLQALTVKNQRFKKSLGAVSFKALTCYFTGRKSSPQFSNIIKNDGQIF